jgi:hypothetical protein
MQQAQDTFVAEMADGSQVRVVKGEFLPESHELVKRDQDGAGMLFKQVYLAEDEKAAPKSTAKADPKAAPAKAKGPS